MPQTNKLGALTDKELIEGWQRIVNGSGCGCPSCSRDYLDEIASRFKIILEMPHVKQK